MDHPFEKLKEELKEHHEERVEERRREHEEAKDDPNRKQREIDERKKKSIDFENEAALAGEAVMNEET